MKTTVCHIFSDVQQGSFFTALFDFMDKEKYELCFIMVADRPNDFFELLRSKGCEVHFVKFTGRKRILTSVLEMRKLLKKIRPDIVHTHLVDGSLVGLIGAKLAGIQKRVSYRHHSNECHEYFPHAVYYDKLINYLSRYVVANTRITADVLTEMENVPSEKVKILNYGFNIDGFDVSEKSAGEIGQYYGLEGHYPIVGVVSRFVQWKGVQYIIPAFKRLLTDYPNAKLVFANGVGIYEDEIKRLLDENLSRGQYVLIEFERQIYSLFKTFDVFVHTPIGKYYEAFGQIYVEALGIGVPSVFTISGIANDFIVNEENALVVPYCDSGAIHKAIKRTLEDDLLRDRMVTKGQSDVRRLFAIERLTRELDILYSSL